MLTDNFWKIYVGGGKRHLYYLLIYLEVALDEARSEKARVRIRSRVEYFNVSLKSRKSIANCRFSLLEIKMRLKSRDKYEELFIDMASNSWVD